MEFKVEEYISTTGKCYIREFLVVLKEKDVGLWQKTVEKILRLKSEAFHKTKAVNPLKKGLFELKPKHATGTTRITFCFGITRTIYLLKGEIKKGSKKRQNRLIKESRKLMEELKFKKLI